jgi:predicted CXXCH cytochrome family protein
MHGLKQNVLLYSAVSLLMLLVPVPAAAQDACVTDRCHAGMLKQSYTHPGTESCDTCHQAGPKSHPQKGKKTFSLTQDAPGLCTQCHTAMTTLKFVHTAVTSGSCTDCHNVHAGEHKLLARQAKDLCATCHPDKTDHKFVHGPAATGDCVSCHRPHDGDNKVLLVKEGQDLCFSCHTDMQEQIRKKVVHQALAGGCTSCHNPHGSAARMFFSAAGSGLCFQCHGEMESRIKSAKSVHPPLQSERGCASCHAPHAADAAKLLSRDGKDLCLDCHKGFLKKSFTVLHGPIKEGKCQACHDPHASTQEKLLPKSYSSDFYISYSEKEYELCFSCHKRELLKYPTTSYATNFRDGDRNLHYLHVNRQDKGRNCKSCHVIHGGEIPKLPADSVTFGKWNLPLRYVKTETGGSCAPGCHKKYSYDRKNPGKETAPAKSKNGKEQAQKK